MRDRDDNFRTELRAKKSPPLQDSRSLPKHLINIDLALKSDFFTIKNYFVLMYKNRPNL